MERCGASFRTNKKKKPYETQASMDRDRYKKAMHSYSSGLLKDEDLEDEGDEGDEPLDEDPSKQADPKRHKNDSVGLEEQGQVIVPPTSHHDHLFALALQTAKVQPETVPAQPETHEDDNDEGDVDDEDEGDEGDDEEEDEL